MSYKHKISAIKREEQIQKAIIALKNEEFISFYAAARHF